MPGSFPNLSNIYPELETTLKKRAGNNNPWNAKENPGVSGLSTWMRLLSGVGGGCILESINPKATDFSKVYGSSGGKYTGPGAVGRNFNGDLLWVPSGTSRALRPSPIITSMTMDEKAEGGSRLATIKIRAFTKEQCDVLAGYFLEPGFHALCEFGWNTQKSNEQKVGTGGKVTACDLVAYDSWTTIKEKRIKSDFTYDAFLGVVTGGGISFGDNESYEMEVKLTAIGNIAEYMQTHRDANNTSTDDKKSGETFKPQEIESAVGDNKIGAALFMQMFNQLPGQKRTITTYNLWNNPRWSDTANFVNMDKVVAETLKDALTESAELKTDSGKDLEIPKELPLLSEEKFIRFELACEIINTYPFDLSRRKGSGKCSHDSRSKIINIKNTYISGFPHMFSTDPTKLFIPNPTTPNFKFLEALSAKSEITSFIEFSDLSGEKNFANIHPEAELKEYRWLTHTDSRFDPSTKKTRIVPYAFPNTQPLNVTSACDNTFIPIQEKAGFWGYLKDLYINFNFFVECISKPNLVIRDVFYEMLNGMSGACNSIWKFQIQEVPLSSDPNGPIELAVVDLNFLGDISNNSGITTFQSRGVKSPFISCDFSVEVPAAMMSSVVNNKLKDEKGKTYDHSPELNPRPMLGSVFSRKEDNVGTILAGIQQAEKETKEDPPDTSNKASERKSAEELETEAKIANFEFFIKTGAVYPKIQNREAKLDITKAWYDWNSSNDNTIENVVMVGAWNDTAALRQCFLVDKGLTPKQTLQKKAANNTQNPPFGVADFDFKVHGVSGFKVGDQLQIDGLPDKFGAPNVFQVVKVDHTLDGMTWTTDVKTKLRIVGGKS